MPANLYLAPVGTDKTASVVDGLLDSIQNQHRAFPKVWVLTANRRQAMSFRQRLVDRSEAETTFFNIEYFSFYTLNVRLLNLAGQPARRIPGLTQFGVAARPGRSFERQGRAALFSPNRKYPWIS